MRNLTLCNNCAGKVVLSLGEHVEDKGLVFCSAECQEAFYSPENTDNTPIGLAYDLGVDCY